MTTRTEDSYRTPVNSLSSDALPPPRPALCYVLPMYERTSEQHFIHTVDFLRAMARHVELTVLVERGEAPEISGARVFLLPQWSVLSRVAGLIGWALILRLQGYRKFFVRISVPAALPLCLLRPLGVRTYYWNCGMTREAPLPWSFSWKGLRQILAKDVRLGLTIRFCHRLVTGPERMAQYYVDAFGVDPRKVVVCYNDINLERFPPPSEADRARARAALRIPEGRTVVLSVHRHSPIRRPLFYFPEIIRAVAAEDPSVLFLLVGGGPQEKAVRDAIASAGLEQYARAVGPVPNLAVPTYYSAADLFIMPSWTEGFPRVLLEAMAIGLPFVTTDAGGVDDLLSPKQRQNMLPRDELAGFAATIARLAAQPQERRALASEGRNQVQRFTTERVVEMYLQRIVTAP